MKAIKVISKNMDKYELNHQKKILALVNDLLENS